MALKSRKRILLAKKETTYGVDAVPTGAANAILTHGLQIRPLEGASVNRDVDRPHLGNSKAIQASLYGMVEFDVEFAGSGTAVDTPPAWGPLMLGCGLAETINAATSVEYNPVSSGEDSLTLYVHKDGNLHKLLGARGTFSIRMSPEGIPYFHFVFTGLWVAPSAVADPVPDYSSFKEPVPVTNTNTPTFTLGGNPYTMVDFSYDHANQVNYRNVVGEESVQIVDRAPAGSLTLDQVLVSSKNWFTAIRDNESNAFQSVHGTVANNIIQLDAPGVQVTSPSEGDDDGTETIQMNTLFVPSDSGDDEIKITCK